MPTTPNLGLVNVLESEEFDIDMWNGNMTKIDAFAGTTPKKTVIYSSASGTAATVPLSDSAANYSYLIISSIDNNGDPMNDVTVVNGQKTWIQSAANGTDSTVFRSAQIMASGTTITFDLNKISWIDSGGYSADPLPGVSAAKITKVVGVKGF